MLAVVYAATALPFTIYLLSGYFATLPKAYEEAAYVDGAAYTAGPWCKRHLAHGSSPAS